jgi:hypothetical protein
MVVSRGRQVELADDVIAYVRRFRERLHAQSVPVEAGDVELPGDAAGGQDEIVVVLADHLVHGGAHDGGLRLGVHADHPAGQHGGPPQQPPQRYGDRLRGQDPGGHVRQQRQIELMVLMGDQGDVGLLRREPSLQPVRALQARESAADDQDLPCCHRGLLGWVRRRRRTSPRRRLQRNVR